MGKECDECDECWKDTTNETVVCEECYNELLRLKNKYEDALKKIERGINVWLIDSHWMSAQQLRKIAEKALE